MLSLRGHAAHIVALLRSLGRPEAWILGHSMGGATAMLAVDQAPELFTGIINVEGNFTPEDAFWSRQIADLPPEQWAGEYHRMEAAPEAWLTRWGVEPTPVRVEWAERILRNQPAETVATMARAIVKETAEPGFPEAVRRVVARGLPLHLIAGQRSGGNWNVPGFVREAAASYAEQPGAGHLMMLEDPAEFCRLVDACLSA